MSDLPGGDTAGTSAGRSDQAQAHLLKQFRALSRVDARRRQWLHRAAGVGGAQAAALLAIQRKPGMGVNELASQLDVRQPTASNLVHSLFERGLVLRQTGGRDRRVVRLFISSAGQALLTRTPLREVGGLEAALQRLDGALLHELEQDLARLLVRLGKAQPGTQSTL